MRKILLTLVLMLIAAIDTFAYDFKYNGLNYTILSNENHTCCVTRNNITGNIDIPATVEYNGTEYKVVEIGNKAFYDCSELTSVNIPNSVTDIGDRAFRYCI